VACPYQKINLAADRHIPRCDLKAATAADPLRGLADSDVVAANVPAGPDVHDPTAGVLSLSQMVAQQSRRGSSGTGEGARIGGTTSCLTG
jgi:hypothetical protein